MRAGIHAKSSVTAMHYGVMCIEAASVRKSSKGLPRLPSAGSSENFCIVESLSSPAREVRRGWPPYYFHNLQELVVQGHSNHEICRSFQQLQYFDIVRHTYTLQAKF